MLKTFVVLSKNSNVNTRFFPINLMNMKNKLMVRIFPFRTSFFIKVLIVAIDRIINNLDKELKTKQKELEQLKVCSITHLLVLMIRFFFRIPIEILTNMSMKKNEILINMKLNYVMLKIKYELFWKSLSTNNFLWCLA